MDKYVYKALKSYSRFSDRSHGLDHILAVADIALSLGADKLTYLAAILHDIAREAEMHTGIEHAELGTTYARKLLRGMDKAEVDSICRAIKEHNSKSMQTTVASEIVYDADKLSTFESPETCVFRMVEYRRARGMPSDELKDDARKFATSGYYENRMTTLRTAKGKELGREALDKYTDMLGRLEELLDKFV